MPRWTKGEWAEWKLFQSKTWSPQEVAPRVDSAPSQSKAAKKKELEDALVAKIAFLEQHQSIAAQSTAPTAPPSAADSKQATEKIKVALAFRATVSDPALIKTIDAQIAVHRKVARESQILHKSCNKP